MVPGTRPAEERARGQAGGHSAGHEGSSRHCQRGGGREGSRWLCVCFVSKQAGQRHRPTARAGWTAGLPEWTGGGSPRGPGRSSGGVCRDARAHAGARRVAAPSSGARRGRAPSGLALLHFHGPRLDRARALHLGGCRGGLLQGHGPQAGLFIHSLFCLWTDERGPRSQPDAAPAVWTHSPRHPLPAPESGKGYLRNPPSTRGRTERSSKNTGDTALSPPAGTERSDLERREGAGSSGEHPACGRRKSLFKSGHRGPPGDRPARSLGAPRPPTLPM